MKSIEENWKSTDTENKINWILNLPATIFPCAYYLASIPNHITLLVIIMTNGTKSILRYKKHTALLKTIFTSYSQKPTLCITASKIHMNQETEIKRRLPSIRYKLQTHNQ